MTSAALRLSCVSAGIFAAQASQAAPDNPSPARQLKLQVAPQAQQAGDSEKQIDVLAFNWGSALPAPTGDPDRPLIAGNVPNPSDPASGQATGKRQHKPLTVTKEWDAASPQLMKLDRPAAKGSVWIRTSQPWADCRVGARYPAAELDGYKLSKLTVAKCPRTSAAEGITIAYEHIIRVK